MTEMIVADLIRTDGTSQGVNVALDEDGQPPSAIEKDGVHYGFTEYFAAKGVAAYHERGWVASSSQTGSG
jgi:hypothetical protein